VRVVDGKGISERIEFASPSMAGDFTTLEASQILLFSEGNGMVEAIDGP
jgi:hypothetical protein